MTLHLDDCGRCTCRPGRGAPAVARRERDAVIVSGYDGDGAAASCGIRQVGGVTIAQKLDTPRQPDMPESAIAAGCVDFVLSPEDTALTIGRVARQALQSVE